MNDNGIPGVDHPNFRLFSDGTEVWAANTLAYVMGGGPGAWIMQDVDAAHGLPVSLVGMPVHTGVSTVIWPTGTAAGTTLDINVKGQSTVVVTMKDSNGGTAHVVSFATNFYVEDGNGNWQPILGMDMLGQIAPDYNYSSAGLGVGSVSRVFNVAGWVNFRISNNITITQSAGTGQAAVSISVQASPAALTPTLQSLNPASPVTTRQGDGPNGPFTPWFVTIMDIDGASLMPVGADVTTCIFTRAILIDENGDPRGVSPASAPYTKSIVVNDSGVPLGQAQVQGVYVNSTPITSPTGGSTPFRRISTASTNAVNVKASAGTLYMLIAVNTNAAPRYLKLYDKATAPNPAADTPILTLTIPGNTNGGGFSLPIPAQGLAFLNGIGYAMTTGVVDGDNSAVAANEITLNGAYS